MHQKVLKINIRPSYNSENTVCYFDKKCLLQLSKFNEGENWLDRKSGSEIPHFLIQELFKMGDTVAFGHKLLKFISPTIEIKQFLFIHASLSSEESSSQI